MSTSTPSPNNEFSIEIVVPTVTTTSGPQTPVVETLEPVLLQEEYQRIDASRFMR